MARKFIILLMTFVALQFTWTAVSAYCGHETGRAAQHFGHHQHAESADELATTAKDNSSSLTKKLTPHADCASCSHANVALAGLEPAVSHPLANKCTPCLPVPALASAYTAPPERPQWHSAV